MGGRERGRHLIAADGSPAGAPVEPREPGRHQGETRQHAEQQHRHDHHDRPGPRLPDRRAGPDCSAITASQHAPAPATAPAPMSPPRPSGENMPSSSSATARAAPTAPSRAPPGQPYASASVHAPSTASTPAVTISVVAGPRTARPGRARPGDRADPGHREQHRADRGQREFVAGQHPGRQRPADRGEPRDRAPRGGPPAPGPYVEVVRGLVGASCTTGAEGASSTAPDAAPRRRHARRRQRRILGERRAVGRRQMAEHRAAARTVAEQPHDFGQQQPNWLFGRQNEIDPTLFTDQSDPAQCRTAHRSRSYHACDGLSGRRLHGGRRTGGRRGRRGCRSRLNRSPVRGLADELVRNERPAHTTRAEHCRNHNSGKQLAEAFVDHAARAAPRTEGHREAAGAVPKPTPAIGCHSPARQSCPGNLLRILLNAVRR